MLPNDDVKVGYKATLTCAIQDPADVDNLVLVWKEATGTNPKTFTMAHEYVGYINI